MGKKQPNINYAFVFYDVKEKRVHKIFKVCKRYLNSYQNSVFRGEITQAMFIELQNEIKRIIVQEEDFVSFIGLVSLNQLVEIEIGSRKMRDGEEDFI